MRVSEGAPLPKTRPCGVDRPLLTAPSLPAPHHRRGGVSGDRTPAPSRRGQDWIGAELGLPARTVSAILHRHDLPCLRDGDPLTGALIRASKTTAVRYERAGPGELIHMDVNEIGRIPNGSMNGMGLAQSLQL